MADMPKRPREHELESESRTAFRQLVERQGWVVRPVDSPDYGIDDQVEVFDEHQATGLMFSVQVRGTDEPDLKKALRVRVRAEQQAYFAALTGPVLIVRYQGGSKRLFARWFHRFDPHPRRGGETLRLQASDELTEARVALLADEVRLFRTVSSIAVAWPLAVKVASASMHNAPDLILAMGAVAGDRQPYVRFISGEEQPDSVGFTVELMSDRMVVHGGLSSVTMHGALDHRPLEDVAADAVLAVGVVFGMLDQLDAAAALISASAAYAPALEGKLLALAVGPLARGSRIGAALGIGQRLLLQGRRTVAQAVVSLVALAAHSAMTDDELNSVVAFEKELASAAEADGDLVGAAAICYSLGNWLFSVVHDWDEALGMFERAAEFDPTYANRDYFMHEYAGALFECGRYADAVGAYERAAAGAGSPGTLARLADALLMGGRYTEAAAMFDRYMTDPEPSEPAWELKAAIARLLVGEGFDVQVRDEDLAFRLAVEAQEIDDPIARLDKCKEALGFDALCAPAWQMIALVRAEQDLGNVAIPLLVGAVAARDPDAWAITLFLLLGADEAALARRVAEAGLLDSHSAFPDAIRRAGAFFGAESQTAASAIVRDAQASLVPPRPGFTVRMLGADGSLVERHVGPED